MVDFNSFEKENINNQIDNILDDTPATSEETGKSLTLDNIEISSTSSENSATDDYYNKYKLSESATINTNNETTGSDIRIPENYETRVNPNDPRYTQMYINGYWYDINVLPNSIVLDNGTVSTEKTELIKHDSEELNKKGDAAKYDKGKLQITLMPTEIIRAITEVRMFGAKKYKPANWINVSKRRYKDALLRHILEYIDNEDAVDSESGLPALWHAACNIAFLIDMHRKDWDKRKEQIEKNFADMEK